MTLFERVFNGNDAVYGLTEQAIDAAIAQHSMVKRKQSAFQTLLTACLAITL